MDSDKVKCTAAGCDHLILPATATRTGGLCMRCMNARQAAERREYIRKNRREVDPYAGMTDLVEIIRTVHSKKGYDPLVVYRPPPKPFVQLYGELSAAQAGRLMQYALGLDDEDVSDEIAQSLATLTTHDLTPLQAAWVGEERFWPAVIFRGAPPLVRDHMIAVLETARADEAERLGINHMLCALAWIGDDVVQQVFARWERRPPVWRSSLRVSLNMYAQTGGWELRDGRRKNLFYPECWGVEVACEGTAADPALATFSPAEGICPWCSRPLVNLVKLDAHDARFVFLEVNMSALTVLGCEVCTAFSAHILARIDSTGRGAWHEANTRPRYLPADHAKFPASSWRGHRCQLVRRPAMQAVDSVCDADVSQIGGYPAWVQDSAYPVCPDCRQTMILLAQLDNSHFEQEEGVYYAFLCAGCRVTAAAYQQT